MYTFFLCASFSLCHNWFFFSLYNIKTTDNQKTVLFSSCRTNSKEMNTRIVSPCRERASEFPFQSVSCSRFLGQIDDKLRIYERSDDHSSLSRTNDLCAHKSPFLLFHSSSLSPSLSLS